MRAEILFAPVATGYQAIALGIYATLVGALQLARAAEGTESSDCILPAGRDAARELVRA